MRGEWFQQGRQHENEIIERSSCVRRGSGWEVFKVVAPYDQSWILRAHPNARHPSVTIGIGEINIPSDKDVLIIRAASRQDQYAENCDFNDAQDSTNHHAIPNPRLKMRNPKIFADLALCGLVTSVCYVSMFQCRVIPRL